MKEEITRGAKKLASEIKEKCALAERFSRDYNTSSGILLFASLEKNGSIDMFEIVKNYFFLREKGYSVNYSAKAIAKFYEDISTLTFELGKEKLEGVTHGVYETRGGKKIPSIVVYYELRKRGLRKVEYGIRPAITHVLSSRESRMKVRK